MTELATIEVLDSAEAPVAAAGLSAPTLVATATPFGLIQQAVANGASLDIIEKLMALQERHDANQARKAFDEAMAAAKAEIPIITKNRTVDFTSAKGRTHYRHEDLAEIARTVNPILGKHGLSYRFRTTANVNEPVSVTCIVTHRLGYFEENTLVGPRDETGNKNSLQQVGSTLTYLQRMTLKAALGLAAAEDDDGQKAGIGDVLSDEQADEIRRLVTETKTDLNKFLTAFKAESVPDMAAADFDRARSMLLVKKSKMQPNASGGEND